MSPQTGDSGKVGGVPIFEVERENVFRTVILYPLLYRILFTLLVVFTVYIYYCARTVGYMQHAVNSKIRNT